MLSVEIVVPEPFNERYIVLTDEELPLVALNIAKNVYRLRYPRRPLDDVTYTVSQASSPRTLGKQHKIPGEMMDQLLTDVHTLYKQW